MYVKNEVLAFLNIHNVEETKNNASTVRYLSKMYLQTVEEEEENEDLSSGYYTVCGCSDR